MIYLNFRHIVLTFILFFNFSYAKEWNWSPPCSINQNKKVQTATNPFLAANRSKDAILVWYEREGLESDYGSLHAARLNKNLLNENKLQWESTDLVVSYGVELPYSSIAQSVGVDDKGNGYIVWKNNENQIYSAYLSNTERKWHIFENPLNSNRSIMMGCPSITVAPNGDAIVLWTQLMDSGCYSVLSNFFDSQAMNWKGESVVWDKELESVSSINKATFDYNQGIAVISSSEGLIGVSSLSPLDNSWKVRATLDVSSLGSPPFVNFDIDAKSNVIVTWIQTNGYLYAAVLPKNQTKFQKMVCLSDKANDLSSYPMIKSDKLGNTLVVWAENNLGLGSARFSSLNSNWNLIHPLNLKGKNPINISLSSTDLGNVAATWVVFDSSGGFIHSASLDSQASSWSALINQSLKTKQDQNPQICFIDDNHQLIVWECDNGINFSGEIRFSMGTSF